MHLAKNNNNKTAKFIATVLNGDNMDNLKNSSIAVFLLLHQMIKRSFRVVER